MVNMQRRDISIAGLLLVFITAGSTANEYMDKLCGQTIEIGDSGGSMYSQVGFYYDNDLNCTVTISADSGQRILLTFKRVDIAANDASGCDGDYLEIYDGTSTPPTPDVVVCGSSAENFASLAYSVTLTFKTDSVNNNQGFLLSYTAFTTSLVCPPGRFECDNGRCIDEDLKFNFNDNCGDNSDENIDLSGLDNALDDAINTAYSLGIGIIVAIIVGAIVGVVLICLCVGCICYHVCCKKSPSQQTSYQVVAQTPQQQQQPPMAMQPTGQPGAYPAGQPAYPPGQQGYPVGQPVYPPAQPGGYPAGEKV